LGGTTLVSPFIPQGWPATHSSPGVNPWAAASARTNDRFAPPSPAVTTVMAPLFTPAPTVLTIPKAVLPSSMSATGPPESPGVTRPVTLCSRSSNQFSTPVRSSRVCCVRSTPVPHPENCIVSPCSGDVDRPVGISGWPAMAGSTSAYLASSIAMKA
jgi:hypothetical protein